MSPSNVHLESNEASNNQNIMDYKKEKEDVNFSFAKNSHQFAYRNSSNKSHLNQNTSVQNKREKTSDEHSRKKHKKKRTLDVNSELKCKKKKAFEFPYGNYHQYYGFRNAGQEDPRMSCMKHEWFANKDILDIGCNAGHFTLAIASYFSPKSIIGVDIDPELIHMANKNVRHYITDEHQQDLDFPMSLVLNFGPVAVTMDPKERCSPKGYPFNVQFVQTNYILPSDNLLDGQEAYFDTVLCLSVTKWVHLNWGDNGIHMLFRRVYKHLRPGGCFILEAQAFPSYARKKKITEESFHHYKSIKLFPEMFNEYLLKEVGFETCDLLDVPAHTSQGFCRPIYLFHKPKEVENKPQHVFYETDSEDERQKMNTSDLELSD